MQVLGNHAKLEAQIMLAKGIPAQSYLAWPAVYRCHELHEQHWFGPSPPGPQLLEGPHANSITADYTVDPWEKRNVRGGEGIHGLKNRKP